MSPPAVTAAQSAQEAHAISESIDEAAKRQDWPAVVSACRQALDHPCASHAFYVADIWTGLAEAYAIQERYDEAIDALRAAVAAGHKAWPHPETDIARLHLMAGRRADADAVFASVRERTPDDIWLFQTAGDGYAGFGDHAAALEWLTAGLELGLRTGDPDGIVSQLNEARTASLSALGRGPDELSIRARLFAEDWVRPAPGTVKPLAWPDEPAQAQDDDADARPCEHCGWTELSLDPAELARRRDPNTSRPMAVAFFTADEWPRAVALWPHLLDEMPADHFAYVRELQSRILEISEATGARLIMVPMSVGGLMGFCEDREKLHPGSGEARAEYAGMLIHDGHGRTWPPGRNESCWCGSGRKYKVCCGTVATPQPLRSV